MGKQLQVEATSIFEKNWEAFNNPNIRTILNVGGTRSSKSYSIVQMLIVKALSSPTPTTVSIVRKSLPSLKSSVLKDFVEILQKYEIYDEANHNKTDNLYKLNAWTFEFFSIQDAERRRGSRRDILFINEATELSYEDYFQLSVRTVSKVIADWNPSQIFYLDELIGQKDVAHIHSTYKDNTFLGETQIKEIEKLQYTDEAYWRTYGLGLYSGGIRNVYSFNIVDGIDEDKIEKGDIKLIGLGLDWGYINDETAVVEVWKEGEDTIYVNELLYKKGLTNNDIADELRRLGVDRYVDIIADSAEQKSIAELHRQGFNIKPCQKGRGSILNGIDIVKRYKILVTAQSTNVIKELSNYSWIVDKDNNMLNKPIDAYNHSLDALRYICTAKLSKTSKSGKYNIKISGNTIM